MQPQAGGDAAQRTRGELCGVNKDIQDDLSRPHCVHLHGPGQRTQLPQLHLEGGDLLRQPRLQLRRGPGLMMSGTKEHSEAVSELREDDDAR